MMPLQLPPLARHAIAFAVVTGLILASVLVGLHAASTLVAAGLTFALLCIAATLAGALFLLARRELNVERNLGRLRDYGQAVSIYDKESGLYADWYFGVRLDEEIARAQRYRQPFTLLLIEDSEGYLGETVKRLVFAALENALRNTDIVAHLTDKRFAALLTNTDAEGALIATDRVRESLPLRAIHIGMATYPADGRDAPSMLTAAGASSDLVSAITRRIRKPVTRKTHARPLADATKTEPASTSDATHQATPSPQEETPPNVVQFRPPRRRCTSAGCERPHHALGLCSRHYAQQRNRVA